MHINKIINYTAADFQKAYNTHLITNHPIRTFLLPGLGAFCLIMGIILKFIVSPEESSNSLSTFCIIYGFGIIIYFFFKMRTIGGRLFKKMNDYHQPIQFSISNDGLMIDSSSMHTNIQWITFTKAIVKENIVMLYPNEMAFYFFDKNHFADNEFSALKELVKNKVVKVK